MANNFPDKRKRLTSLLRTIVVVLSLVALAACSADFPANDLTKAAASAQNLAQGQGGQPATLPQTGAGAQGSPAQGAGTGAGIQGALSAGQKATPAAVPSLGSAQPATPAASAAGTTDLLASPGQGASVSRRITVVVLGVDNRPTESFGRSDTIIVLTYDPQSGSAGIISLTRDLLVTIPGLPFRAKINTANYYGDLYKMPGGGPELLRKSAQAFLGYPVDYWVRINFDGFREIIDRIGGIDVNVPQAIDDPQFPDDNFGFDPLYIPAGQIHMDGALALKYARTRHEDSDYGRVRRQQQVILAVMHKVLQPGNLGLLPQLPSLALTLGRSIQTNMPIGQVIGLMARLTHTGPPTPTSVVIDDKMGTIGTDPAWGWVLIPDMAKVHAAVEPVFAGH